MFVSGAVRNLLPPEALRTSTPKGVGGSGYFSRNSPRLRVSLLRLK
jgi:hypothetical protein